MSTRDQINPTHTTNDYPHQVRALQAHAGVFAVTMVLIFAVNLTVNLSAGIAGQWSAWWSVWALIGWSFGIAVHGLVLFLARPGNGSSGHPTEGGADIQWTVTPPMWSPHSSPLPISEHSRSTTCSARITFRAMHISGRLLR